MQPDLATIRPDVLSGLQRRLESPDLALPVLPETAVEVVSVCNANSCDAGRLAQLIQRDQSLAAHTLKIANSSAYAPHEPIVSLQQAISRLGFRTMCDIALATALRNQVRMPAGHEARMRALWTHSTIAGAWAREIARLRRRNVEGAFLCGLLHDIGKPVVLAELLRLPAELGFEPDAAVIDALLHEHHAAVGARTLAAWKLPEWMSQAVLHHHAPDAAGEHAEYARTAQLADLLAHASLHPDPQADAILGEHPVLADLDLYGDDLQVLLERRETVVELARAYQ